MTTIEEQIWDYIDGNCKPEERLLIASKIASDESYKLIYQELMTVNQHLQTIDLDEPSMAFTRKVMDGIDLEASPVSLKTKVDSRIIYALTGFFVLTMFSILLYALSQTHFTPSTAKLTLPAFDLEFNRYLTPTLIRIFLFVDLLLAFIYLDGFLSRKKIL